MKTNKSLFLLIALIVIALTSFGQQFEGKIIYKNSYKSKIPNVTDEQLNAMMGTQQDFHIKGGNYKSVMNGQIIQWQLYINKDNKLYTKTSQGPAVYWNDGSMNMDEVIKTEVNKGVIDILAYSCDEIILTTKSGLQKFYFNSKFGMDPKYFENHKFGNWNEYISKAKAVPLKLVMDTPQFSIESVATEILPQNLEDKLFALPEDAPLEKNPYIK